MSVNVIQIRKKSWDFFVQLWAQQQQLLVAWSNKLSLASFISKANNKMLMLGVWEKERVCLCVCEREREWESVSECACACALYYSCVHKIGWMACLQTITKRSKKLLG